MRKFLKAVNVFRMPENPTVAGQRLIFVSIAGWSLMHITFFGVPRFSNKGELGYAVSSFVIVAIGCAVIIREKRARANRTPRLPG